MQPLSEENLPNLKDLKEEITSLGKEIDKSLVDGAKDIGAFKKKLDEFEKEVQQNNEVSGAQKGEAFKLVEYSKAWKGILEHHSFFRKNVGRSTLVGLTWGLIGPLSAVVGASLLVAFVPAVGAPLLALAVISVPIGGLVGALVGRKKAKSELNKEVVGPAEKRIADRKELEKGKVEGTSSMFVKTMGDKPRKGKWLGESVAVEQELKNVEKSERNVVEDVKKVKKSESDVVEQVDESEENLKGDSFVP